MGDASKRLDEALRQVRPEDAQDLDVRSNHAWVYCLGMLLDLAENDDEQLDTAIERVAVAFGASPDAVRQGMRELDAIQRQDAVLDAVDRLGSPYDPDALRDILRRTFPLPELYQARVRAALLAKTGLGKRELNRVWSDERRAWEAETKGRRANDRNESHDGRPIKRILPDAPVPDDMRVPPGYIVAPPAGAILKEEGFGRDGEPIIAQVSPVPIVITSRYADLITGIIQLECAAKLNGVYKPVTAPRNVFLDARKIVDLADRGFAVGSANARAVAEWLQTLEIANIHAIPERMATSQLGWLPGDPPAFALGGRVLTRGGEREITVLPPDAGEQQFALAITCDPSGGPGGWLDMVFRRAVAYPRIRLGIYHALASVLLPILGVQGTVLHYSGLTSHGKTVALQVAASVWGYPGGSGLSRRQGLIRGWEATLVANERLLAFAQHLPVFLDDSQQQAERDRHTLSQTVYMIADGQGRRRGSLKGSQTTRTWHLNAVSSGEERLVDTTRSGGIRPRCADLWGNQLARTWDGGGERDAAAVADDARRADELRAAVDQFYGHAGELFVRAVLDLGFDHVRDMWADRRRRLAGAAEYAGITLEDMGSRLVGPWAAAWTAADVFHQAAADYQRAERREPWIERELTAEETARYFIDGWLWYLGGNKPRHAALDAYDLVLSHAISNREAFLGGSEDGTRVPAAGWEGRWQVDVPSRGVRDALAFFPNRLELLLGRFGFDYVATIKGWDELGLLISDKDERRLTMRVRFGSGRDAPLARMVVLRRVPPYDGMMGDEADADGPEADKEQLDADDEEWRF